MIEIIICLFVFGFIGYLITTVFGYVWVGLASVFVIVGSITLGAFILYVCCAVGAGILKGLSAGLNTKRSRRVTHHHNTLPRHQPYKEQPSQTIIQIAVPPEGVRTRRVDNNNQR